MDIAKILGISGLCFNIAGALLVIEQIITFQHSVSKTESMLTYYIRRFVFRFMLSIINYGLKRASGPGDDVLIFMKESLLHDKLPDRNKLQQMICEYETQYRSSLRKKRKKKSIPKRTVLLKGITQSFVLRAILFENPYIFPTLTFFMLSRSLKYCQKHQMGIGASLLVLGFLLQIIEKVIA